VHGSNQDYALLCGATARSVLHRTAHAKAKGPKEKKHALRQPPMFAVSIDLGMCMGSTEISNTYNNNNNNSNNNPTQHISGLAGN
jgi:hypothetical protein